MPTATRAPLLTMEKVQEVLDGEMMRMAWPFFEKLLEATAGLTREGEFSITSEERRGVLSALEGGRRGTLTFRLQRIVGAVLEGEGRTENSYFQHLVDKTGLILRAVEGSGMCHIRVRREVQPRAEIGTDPAAS